MIEMGADANGIDGERAAAWMSAFALCFRNGSSSELRELLGAEGTYAACTGQMYQDVYQGRLDGRHGVEVWISFHACWLLLYELAEGGDPLEKSLLHIASIVSQQQCSATRVEEILPHIMVGMDSDDMVLAATTTGSIGVMFVAMPAVVIPIFVANGMAHKVWDLRRRIAEPGQPASWWQERYNAVHLDTVCLTGVAAACYHYNSNVSAIPHDRLHDSMLAEAIHRASPLADGPFVTVD